MAQLYSCFLDISSEQRTSIKAASSGHRAAQGKAEQSPLADATLAYRQTKGSAAAEGRGWDVVRCAPCYGVAFRRVGRSQSSPVAPGTPGPVRIDATQRWRHTAIRNTRHARRDAWGVSSDDEETLGSLRDYWDPRRPCCVGCPPLISPPSPQSYIYSRAIAPVCSARHFLSLPSLSSAHLNSILLHHGCRLRPRYRVSSQRPLSTAPPHIDQARNRRPIAMRRSLVAVSYRREPATDTQPAVALATSAPSPPLLCLTPTTRSSSSTTCTTRPKRSSTASS